MDETRPIGRWTITALIINGIIGSAIFGVSSEALRMVGRLSPLAMFAAAVLMGVIILPIAEVASRFSDPGGMYLYARTAFGRFVGLQVGWFWFLAIIGGGAAAANLFMTYLGQFFPSVAHGWRRSIALLIVIAIPAAANYIGARQGAFLSVLFTCAKAAPLAIIIGLGLLPHSFPHHAAQESLPPPGSAWPKLLLLLMFAYSGWEDPLVPAGEIDQPRRNIPFALITGLLVCAVIYTVFQFVLLRTIGTAATDRSVVEAASVLIGNAAGPFVAVAVMLSTYGWLSGSVLNGPRFILALAQHADAPACAGKLHARYQTPSVGTLVYSATVLLLALTGTFLWVIALTAGALTVFYVFTCAALIRLRRMECPAPGFRLPGGPVFAIGGIAISIALLTQVEPLQLALMSITAVLAALNWFWAKNHATRHYPERVLLQAEPRPSSAD